MTSGELTKIWKTAENCGEVTIRELILKASKQYEWSRGQARLQIIKALREGYLRISETNVDFEESFVATSKKPPKESLEISKEKITRTETPLETQDLKNEVDVVATIPDRLKDLCHDVRYRDLPDAFSTLLQQAKKTIRLSLPFLEPNGVWIFLDDVISAATRGVEFRILTRETYNPRENIGWVRKVKALLKLVDTIGRHGPRGENQIKIRDFHTTLMARSSRYQFESSHAKIFIVDDSTAYVGSGEWRENSLFYNFEVGVMLKGSVVQVLTYLFDMIWDHSREINYEILKKRIV